MKFNKHLNTIFIAFLIISLPVVAAKIPFKARLLFQNQRTVFVRGEQNCFVTWRLKCKSKQIAGEKAIVKWGNILNKEIALASMKKNQYAMIKCPVPTYLREGKYQAKIICGNQVKEKTITIVPRFNPMQMPVVMWGIYGRSTPQKRKQLKEIGFTHFLNHGNIKYAREDVVLAAGLRIMCVRGFPDSLKRRNNPVFQITNHTGKKVPETLFALSPKVRKELYETAKKWAGGYSQFPHWSGNLINSEIRDTARIDFSKYSQHVLKNDCGIKIPPEVKDKKGVNYKTVKDFPENGIISETNKIYRFYKWFWEKGDGWNQLDAIINNAIKTCGKKNIWNFHDPAARCLAVYGSGGNVDVLSQWNYVYPNPIRIGYSTDELLCIANGAETSQNVMAMTQISSYRDRLAPKFVKPTGVPPEWLKREFNAPMITVPPDCLSIAFWSKISRPVTGIMYHAWPSLTGQYRTWTDKKKKECYRYTTPNTYKILKELVNNIITPLGATLKKIPDRPADVAFLESFSSQIFTRNTRSLSAHKDGWGNNAYLILRYAHLQPEIIFEDTIARHGLSKYKILVLMDCPVLPGKVYQRILEFQKSGGIIIGDENLTNAITPDISVTSYRLTNQPEIDKAELLRRARNIRRQLLGGYSPYIDSSNQNIIIRARKYASSDYLFIINDNRTFGNYVGQFRRVMEKGIPSIGNIKVRSKNNCLYNLVTHKKQNVVSLNDDSISFNVNLAGAEGRVYLLLPFPIENLKVNIPKSLVAGKVAPITLSVINSKGTPAKAVIPVKVEIINPVGKAVEGTGYYAAVDGRLTINFASAINDTPGEWKVVITELASGLVEKRKFKMSSNNRGKVLEKFPPVIEMINSVCKAGKTTTVKKDSEQELGLEHCISMLDSPSPLIRRRAVRALEKLGKKALPVINKAMKNDDSGVRRIALNILAQKNAINSDVLSLALQDPVAEVQLAAVRIIEANGNSKQFDLLKLAMKSQFLEVRNNASEALMPTGTNNESVRANADFPFVKIESLKLPFKGWKFKLDQDNNGYIKQWFRKKNFSTWNKIEIGKSWEKAGYNYDGIAWYAVDFTLGKDKYDAVELKFSAVDESAWIWLNGKFVGKHDIGSEGWNKAFIIDITNAIKPDNKNTIVVRVKDTRGAGGIWKPVYIDFYNRK